MVCLHLFQWWFCDVVLLNTEFISLVYFVIASGREKAAYTDVDDFLLCTERKKESFMRSWLRMERWCTSWGARLLTSLKGPILHFRSFLADGATSALGRLVFSQLVQNSRDRIHGLLMNQLQYITEINISYCSMYVFYYETK
jgi:hypothetical protein